MLIEVAEYTLDDNCVWLYIFLLQQPVGGMLFTALKPKSLFFLIERIKTSKYNVKSKTHMLVNSQS